ncbi:MAG: hypothetical protein HY298_20185 [Verrucomicrobia bacterium]|nr:hypothetical protein [Verrucomicrobiota bacterium]
MLAQHVVEGFPGNLPKVLYEFPDQVADLQHSSGAKPIPDGVFPSPGYQEYSRRDTAVLLEDLPDTMLQPGLEFFLLHAPSFPGLNVVSDFPGLLFIVGPSLRQILGSNAFGFHQNLRGKFELRPILSAASAHPVLRGAWWPQAGHNVRLSSPQFPPQPAWFKTIVMVFNGCLDFSVFT